MAHAKRKKKPRSSSLSGMDSFASDRIHAEDFRESEEEGDFAESNRPLIVALQGSVPQWGLSASGTLRQAAVAEQGGGALSAAGIYAMLKRFFGRAAATAGEADLDASRFEAASTHWMRHTFARQSLVGGAPLEVVSELMGQPRRPSCGHVKRSAKKGLTNVCGIANIANMTSQPNFPAILRSVRAALNLTQEQLAERLGVSFATVNRWEGGGNRPQRAAQETILSLAAEAGVDSTDAAAPEAADAAAQVTRRRAARGAVPAPSTKPMEQMLWDAACSIRGEKDAAKFKDFLLPLLFLKRLSDVFDDEIGRLAEEYGDRATALEIAESDHSLMRFYLPREARWAVISGRERYEWPLDDKGRSTAPKDLGEHLTKAVRAVVKQNPSLGGVIDIEDFAAERNGERDINPAKLRGVVETFSDTRYRLGLADVQPDFLGRAYEYLLRKFAEGSGQSAGEFFTPTEVGFLIAHVMRPRPGETCHDYACGSAGLLVKLQLVARELDPTTKVPLKLSGQELQAESYAVGQMNAIIHDMDVELARGDTMINPKFRTAEGTIRQHDIVVANPMWNQPFAPDIFANDPFDRFRTTGGITSGKGDWAWLQHTLACMNEHGRAAVVLDTGAVTRGSGSKNEDKERNVRKWFVDRDLIDGVIMLPENLFYNTTAAGVIIILNKQKPAARKNKVVLVSAARYVRKGKPKNYIPEESIRSLAAMFLKAESVAGEVAVVTQQEVVDADYNLSPSRWTTQTEAGASTPILGLIEKARSLSEEGRRIDAQVFELLAPLEMARRRLTAENA